MFSLSEKRNTQPSKITKRRIFLDYAASTPLDKKVLKKMRPFLKKEFYNPSSLYQEAVSVKKNISDYRTKISNLLQVKTNEIYFTSGGTESNNLALLGLFHFWKKKIDRPHFIISSIEHPSSLETMKKIEEMGGEVSFLKVNKEGLIRTEDLKKLLKKNTVLVSVSYANSEIGVIQPINEIAKVIGKYKRENDIYEKSAPYFHIDAAQAPVYLNCNCDNLKADLMTLDGSKIYGPKGIGCLIKKDYVDIENILFGGGQERGLRPGTENVPAIVGFCEAFIKAQKHFKKENKKVSALRDYFWQKLKEEISNLSINGSLKYRIANNLNICVPEIDAEFTVIKLDHQGLACAYTTACKTLGDESKSYVVEALGEKGCSSSSLRFTLGKETKKRELKKAIKIIKKVLIS